MVKSMTKKNVPDVRFKEFSASWDEQTLNTIADIVGGGTPSTQIPEYWDGDIDWYSPTEIGEKVYADESVKKITKLGFEKSGARMLPADRTVLFTSRAGIGDTAILRRTGCTNQGFQSLVLKNGADLYFIYSCSNQIKKFALKYASGSTFLEISGKSLGNMELRIPLLTEQKKIGVSFQNIDHLISLQSKKYEKLLNLKKAMLEKMFPKDGADTPEIRFKGFTEKWKLNYLSDEVDFYSGLTYSPLDVVKEDGTLVLRSSNVQEGEIHLNDNVYVRSDAVNSSNVVVGDIIVVVRNGSRNLIGKHAQIKQDMKYSVIGAFMTGLRPKQSSFINALLDTNLFSKEVEKNLGATINQITTGMFKKMKFMVPIPNEQKAIGSYFDNLNNLIVLHREELKKLKNIKKAMLDKMFV